MPPANSPSDTPPAVLPSSTSSPYLQQLASITSPVPDFASTLMSHPEDDVHNENVLFLRSRRRSSTELSPSRIRTRRRQLVSQTDGPSDMNSSDVRPSRTPAGTNYRIPIVRRQQGNLNNRPNYEDPSHHLNSIYGWAPPTNEDGPVEGRNDAPRGDSLSGSLGRRDSGFWRQPSRELRNTGETSRESHLENQGPVPTSSRRDNPARVTAALLQSVRRHPRFSPRARTLQNYMLDSERNRHDAQDRHDSTGHNPSFTAPNPARPSRSAAAHRGDSSRHSEIRRMYLKDPSVDRLKETIQYLDRVRFSNSYEESLSTAAAGGFVQFEYFLRNEHDFILDTGSITGPEECSWLRPGTVFSGHQQATHDITPPMLSHRLLTSNRSPAHAAATGGGSNRISVYTSSGRGYWAHDVGNNSNDTSNNTTKTEHWPVKVTIHNVDYDTMTLTGTMEAYNIPDKTTSNQGTHIITFLEGEIVDFNTHTLETKNFNAGPEIDSCYWRELEPFKDLTYDEIVKNLVSKKWITEKLSKGWILMRWKERCFVSPSHSRQGLTISGFYYISIRRADGHVEGMYYDPGSSPYQKLSLDPEMKVKMVFPAYNFR